MGGFRLDKLSTQSDPVGTFVNKVMTTWIPLEKRNFLDKSTTSSVFS